jgi:hypothetical protein
MPVYERPSVSIPISSLIFGTSSALLGKERVCSCRNYAITGGLRLKSRRMRQFVLLFITQMPKGQKIETGKLYWVVYKHFPAECQVLGLTESGSIEPKWKNQIRWGLRDAQDRGLIKHVGTPKSGEWLRL